MPSPFCVAWHNVLCKIFQFSVQYLLSWSKTLILDRILGCSFSRHAVFFRFLTLYLFLGHLLRSESRLLMLNLISPMNKCDSYLYQLFFHYVYLVIIASISRRVIPLVKTKKKWLNKYRHFDSPLTTNSISLKHPVSLDIQYWLIIIFKWWWN